MKAITVIFTFDNNDDTLRYLQPLGAQDWAADGQTIVAICPQHGAVIPPLDGILQDEVDVLILMDQEYDPSAQVRETLRVILGKEGVEVGVVLHEGRNNEDRHRHQLEMLQDVHGRRIPAHRVKKEHHNSGPVYNMLVTLGGAVSEKSTTSYASQIRCLVEHVLGDPELERRLNLLHACLTPSGAKALPEHEVVNYGDHAALLITNLREAEQASGLEPDYIEKLSALRDLLLDLD